VNCSMNADHSSTGYSPKVRLWLECPGAPERIKLRQVAPEWIVPASPVTLSAGRAVIVTDIDGREHRRAVVLTEGTSPQSDFVPVRDEPADPDQRALAG